MLTNLLKYFVLLFVCLILYYIIPKKYRWIAIFICSITYYYLMSKSLIIYALISAISIYVFGLIINKINYNPNKIPTIIFFFLSSSLIITLYNLINKSKYTIEPTIKTNGFK